MQILIDIPEDSYKATCNGCMLPPDVENVVNAIRQGTPLPKGHGRLIDADDLLNNTCIDEIPTIIESDTERSNEE